MRVKRCAILSITLLLALLFGIHPIKAEQLPIRTYTTADGLARDRVYKIVPDPRGFLWLCTYDGLSRFDGYEFVNYSIEHGLPHRLVFDLLITRKGDYWVATSNGIARFNPLAARRRLLCRQCRVTCITFSKVLARRLACERFVFNYHRQAAVIKL